MELPPLALLYVLIVVSFGAFVKGFAGFGLPLIAVPLLAQVLDPRTVVVTFAIPTLVSNLVVLVQGNVPRAAVRRARPFLLPLLAGAVAGAALLPALDAQLVSLVIGLAALLFGLLSLVRVQLPLTPRHERVASPVLGAACGVLGGATTIYAPLAALYFQALRYDKWAFVYVLSLLFLAATTVQILVFAALRLYRPELVLGGLLLCLPIAVGTRLGLWLHRRVSASWFRQAVLVLVLLSSFQLIARGLGLVR
jgi:hypothetical protein